MKNVYPYKITLQNVLTLNDSEVNICMDHGLITSIDATGSAGDFKIHFENAIAFPGLINSHDHLDFNLFPMLGNHIYKNYLEWGTDIHHRNKDIIQPILKIPQALRAQWGIYKNILNGVTTVFHHGKIEEITSELIDIFIDKNSLHSVKLEKNWKWKLNNPFNHKSPYIIHTGEGTDETCHDEIDELIRWNKLHKKLIGVHGVAMDEEQAKNFEALVWCPFSNYFLLGKTAAIDQLKKATTIIFGTDSTVSADWNTWKHLRMAHDMQLLSTKELISSVTEAPASLRHLNSGFLEFGKDADIVVAEKNKGQAINAFFVTNPASILLVIKKGNIILFDEKLLVQLGNDAINFLEFEKLRVGERVKYVKGNIGWLMNEIKKYAPGISFPAELM